MSPLRRGMDLLLGQLHAAPVVPDRAAGGAGAASSVCGVWPDVRGTVGAVGAGQLVRAGGAPLRARPLAACRDVGAPHRGTAPVVAGPAGAVAGVAAAGRRPPAAARSTLSASTVQRWLNAAG